MTNSGEGSMFCDETDARPQPSTADANTELVNHSPTILSLMPFRACGEEEGLTRIPSRGPWGLVGTARGL